MPRHKQVTTCRRGGGPVSKTCPCAHCSLAVCVVCGGAEGTLTTDCPGKLIATERRQELCETNLDYTDARGWYLAQPGDLQVPQRYGVKRSPRFESTAVPPEPPRPDPRVAIAPSIDWQAVDRITDLKHELSQKAIAWVLADRIAEDHSAKIVRLEDEVGEHLSENQEPQWPSEQAQELLKTLAYEKSGFQRANQSAEKCDDEFRQTARKLVTVLEQGHVTTVANGTCGCTVLAGTACPHFVAAKEPVSR